MMRFGEFIFSPKTVPTVVFLLTLSLLITLGLWQLNRADEKKQLDIERSKKMSEAVLDINLVGEVMQTDRYLRAKANGEYIQDRHWLLDNQVMNGQAGYHVFSLFKLEGAGEKYLLLDRGWVPTGHDRSVLPEFQTPTGRQQIHGILDNAPSVGIRMGEIDYTRDYILPYLDVEKLGDALSLPLMKYAMVLNEGEPGEIKRDWEQSAEMTSEKHVGYAVQWFALATALIIIYIGVNLKKADKKEMQTSE